jgi:hypothetical protein
MAINGEAAALCEEHQVTDGNETISGKSGFPRPRHALRSEIEMNVGGSPGKSHTSNRYEYINVHPPVGVD